MADVEPMTQLAGKWVITEIGEAKVGSEELTLEFANYRLSGTSTCNSFETAVDFSDIGISFEAGGEGLRVGEDDNREQRLAQIT